MKCKLSVFLFGGVLLAIGLTACTDKQAQKIMSSIHKQEEPKITYYPYLSVKQLRFLNTQNIVGVFSDEVTFPKTEENDLAYDLNAVSWWSLWPMEVQYINNVFAQEATARLGCGPLKAGTTFIISKNIYSYKHYRISVSEPLVWRLKQDIPTMCVTPTKLSVDYFRQESNFWESNYSQNKVKIV